MADHISRKDLKKDEVLETITHGAEAVAAHQQQVWIYGGILLAVVLAIFGWRYYTQSQTARAAGAYGDAMKTYQARIRAVGEAAQPDEITYVDEKNKYSDAAKKFSVVADRYPRTRPGQMARYYEALSLEQLDRNDEAEKDLHVVEASGDEGLISLARFQLALISEKTGKAAQAVQLYQQLADKPTVFVPKAVALMALGDHFGTADPAQAAKFYNQVKTEFPGTQAAQQADEHLQLLPSKG